ncbi:hypothetical protein AMK18_32975 [Streptomyces sp. CB01249]|uniref:hypothetical protein n=1 Tax=Streptomyces sp. CB01249 TaxID=1703929 RepID=UPI00093CB6FC|nr:hypothetical protein [Streptomyces sp. CB01249]OKI92080.1 hypothetical protein AMK18_32975 [Streptomyces sp. CB01249]
MDWLRLAGKGDGDLEGPLIPPATPKAIPGLDSSVATLFGYGLWLVVLAGAGGVGYGVFKLAVSDKSRGGGGSEPFKWMGGGIAAVILAGVVIAVLNGIAGGV